jgi:hypothetical protein
MAYIITANILLGALAYFLLGSYMEKSVIPIYKSQQQGRPSPNSSTSSAAEEPAS